MNHRNHVGIRGEFISPTSWWGWVCFCVWILIIVFLCTASGFAEWSREIVLWQSPEANPSLYTQSRIRMDIAGNVHIAYVFPYRLTTPPDIPRMGVGYVEYDDADNLLAGPVWVSDSTDRICLEPQILLFSTDSLWIMWAMNGNDSIPWESWHMARKLLPNGVLAEPERIWRDPAPFSAASFVAEARPDRSVIFAHIDSSRNSINVIVQNADGSRSIDDEMVWDCDECDLLKGYLDNNDSLQLVWRERTPEWDANFAKRVDTRHPFDISTLADHAELSPTELGSWYSMPELSPVGDTLLGFMQWPPGPTCMPELQVLRRSDYSFIASRPQGRCGDDQPLAVINDSLLAGLIVSREDGGLYLRTYSMPDLTNERDSLLTADSQGDYGITIHSFVAAEGGDLHLTYGRHDHAGHMLVCYRVYSDHLSTRNLRPTRTIPMVQLWPNPSSGIINVSGDIQSLSELKVYNILGQVVFQMQNQARMRVSNYSLPLMTVPAGKYFVEIKLPQSTAVYSITLVR